MVKKIENKEFEKCPVETAIDALAGKWKILILRYLRSETKRFNELQKTFAKNYTKDVNSKVKRA